MHLCMCTQSSTILCSSKCNSCMCVRHCVPPHVPTYINLIARYYWQLTRTVNCTGFWGKCWCVLHTTSQIDLFIPVYFVTFSSKILRFFNPVNYYQRQEWESVIVQLLHSLVSNTIQNCKQDRSHYSVNLALIVRISVEELSLVTPKRNSTFY